jgi:hypothetical protein
MSEVKKVSSGALWIKEGKKGKYFSGQVEIDEEKYYVTFFKNDYKKGDNHPDYVTPKEKKTGNENLPF